MQRAQDVLEFWFGREPLDAARLEERSTFWFGGDGAAAVASRDALIREKLEPLLERAARGEFASWAASPKRRLALIHSLRPGAAECLARHRRRLRLRSRGAGARVEGMQLAADAALDPIERIFFYLPLEHAESMEAQEAAVAAFERLVAEAPAELRGYCEYCLRFARQHRDIIAKFGRFPYRNRVLERDSTPAEIEWLAAHGGSFGQ